LRRDGRQLWIGPDEGAAYLVSLDDAPDVERWPAAKQPIRCARERHRLAACSSGTERMSVWRESRRPLFATFRQSERF
jgi:hypothetical protein